MFLSKKDTPEQFHGMYYAAFLNLFVSAFNLSIYVLGGTWVSLLTSCISLAAVIVIMLVIKRYVTKMLWDKLTARSNDDDNLTAPG